MAGKRPRHVVDERPALTTAGSAMPLGAMPQATPQPSSEHVIDTADACGDTTGKNNEERNTQSVSVSRNRRSGAVAGIVTIASTLEEKSAEDNATQTSNTNIAAVQPGHFAIPAAVLQRISDRLYPTQQTTHAVSDSAVRTVQQGGKEDINKAHESTPEEEEKEDVVPLPKRHEGGNAVRGKPLITSRSWRESVLGNYATDMTAGRHKKPTIDTQTGTTNEDDDVADVKERTVNAASRDEIGDDIIHFDRTVRSASSSSSSSQSNEEEEEEVENEEAMSEEENKAARAPKSSRHSRARLDRHLAAFDSTFLEREEAALLHSDSHSSSSDEEDEELMLSAEEEDEVGDETSAGRGEVLEQAEGEQKEGSDAGLTKSCTGGFGAMNCMRSTAVNEQGERKPQQHNEGDTTSSSSLLLKAGARVGGIRRFRNVLFQCHTPAPVSSTATNESSSDLSYSCHHTLLGLRESISIQGPCGLIGLGAGEVAVQGFLLGRKQLTLWSAEQRVVVQRIAKPLKTRAALLTELPRPPRLQRILGLSLSQYSESGKDVSREVHAVLQPDQFMHAASANTDEESEEQQCTTTLDSAETAAMMYDVESVFGRVDWDWVQATMQAWRRTLGSAAMSDLSLVLILQSGESGWNDSNDSKRYASPMRRHYLHAYQPAGDTRTNNNNNGGQQENTITNSVRHARQKTDSYIEIPAFFARHAEANIDLALLDHVVPSIATQSAGACIVVGSQGIGKSTLCRFLTNVLISQHGSCFWFDLDLGQPEVGMPGQLALHRIHYPLLRPHDPLCAELVTARFLGAVTPRCPKCTAQAVAEMCAIVQQVARHAPVVINTHGWVLQTGRRLTSEVIRRLRPQHAIHLLHAYEEPWLRETATVLQPSCGLNAEVVHRRFLVRWMGNNNNNNSNNVTQGSSKNHNGKDKGKQTVQSKAGQHKRVRDESAEQGEVVSPTAWLASLPHAEFVKKKIKVAAANEWRGQVHIVRVVRDERAMQKKYEARKGTSARQARWQSYLAPLLHYYQAHQLQDTNEGDQEEDNKTTLLQAPLNQLHRIVLADRDETEDLSCNSNSEAVRLAHIAALLEHSVVAVQFRRLHMESEEEERKNNKNGEMKTKKVRVRSLASLPEGFAISCYGYIESSEDELRGVNAWHEPRIALRLPLARSVVAAMLRGSGNNNDKGEDEGRVVLSIAHAAALREDTAFMEQYP